ncbi:MAG: hypothetical protein EOL91_05110 [Actinobacteria bacterium]|nr:hypothetical protein [Actinomycetota bacterium]
MSYDAHIARAFRYAATALVERPGDDVDRETLASLHEDAAVLLTETGTVATGFHPNHRERVRVEELARHPVRVMLTHLNALAHPHDPSGDRPAPSERWAGRPDHPAAVTTAVGAWRGLVVELLQARHALADEVDRRPAPGRAWAVIGDVAALAETLATTMSDLLPPEPPEHKRLSAARTITTSLAVEAREVTRLATAAAGDTEPMLTVGGPRVTGIVTVPRPSRLPDAVTNLTHLLTLEQASVPDLLAVTRVLAQTSRATAQALTSAAEVSGIPDHLTATAHAMEEHADHLAAAVTAHQTALGSITPGSPLLIAQAREIGAIAVPGLRTLHGRPAAAEAASPHLLGYAESIPTVTAALRREFADLDARGLTLVRDRSETAEHGWRRTTPDDLQALIAHLDGAVAAARTAPPPIRETPSRTIPAARVAAGGAFLDLQAALRRRQDALRPTRPAHPMLNCYGPVPGR